MRNISPVHVMAQQSRRMIVSGMFVLLLGLVLVAADVFLIVVPIFGGNWYETLKVGLLVVGGLVLLFGLIRVLLGFRVPRDNPYALRMADYLVRFLDYRYTFVRNISRRGLGYVDAILIGPNGALVFYFLTKRGAFYSERNTWLEQTGGQMRPMNGNPTQEAVKDVNALRLFLQEHDLAQVPVYAVIVPAYDDTAVTIKEPVVPVGHMARVQEVLRDNYLNRERISPALVEETVNTILDGIA
jgi:hypothetical protein